MDKGRYEQPWPWACLKWAMSSSSPTTAQPTVFWTRDVILIVTFTLLWTPLSVEPSLKLLVEMIEVLGFFVLI